MKIFLTSIVADPLRLLPLILFIRNELGTRIVRVTLNKVRQRRHGNLKPGYRLMCHLGEFRRHLASKAVQPTDITVQVHGRLLNLPQNPHPWKLLQQRFLKRSVIAVQSRKGEPYRPSWRSPVLALSSVSKRLNVTYSCRKKDRSPAQVLQAILVKSIIFKAPLRPYGSNANPQTHCHGGKGRRRLYPPRPADSRFTNEHFEHGYSLRSLHPYPDRDPPSPPIQLSNSAARPIGSTAPLFNHGDTA